MNLSKPNQEKTPGKQQNNISLYLWVMVILAVAILPYIPSLKGQFTLDDWHIIVNNPTAHSLKYVPQAFNKIFLTEGVGKNVPYYRPLVTISFQANYMLSGQKPFSYRLVNLLLYAITAVLVFILAMKLTNSQFASGMAAVVFAAVPSHAESVAWVSGRTDILACLFGLIAFIWFLKGLENEHRFSWKWCILCSTAYLCALLSKEITVVMPVLMAAYIYAFGIKMGLREKVKWVVPFAASLFIYALLRHHATGSILGGDENFHLYQRLFNVGITYAAYLRMMFIPKAVSAIYDIFPISAAYPGIAAATLFLPVGLLILGLMICKRQPLIAFSSLWILIALLPVVNIIPSRGPMPTDRFCYLASMGSSIFLGWLISRLMQLRPSSLRVLPVIVMIIGVWFALYSMVLTVISTRTYMSNLDWARAVASNNTRFLRPNSGMFFFDAGYYKDAEKEFKAAIKYQPGDPVNYTCLADTQIMLNQPQKALQTLNQAKDRFGSNLDIEYKAGLAYTQMESWSQAEQSFRNCLKISPKNIRVWRQLANAEMSQHKYDKAIQTCKETLTLPSAGLQDHFNLGIAYKAAGMHKQALNELRYVVDRARGKQKDLAEHEIKQIQQ